MCVCGVCVCVGGGGWVFLDTLACDSSRKIKVGSLKGVPTARILTYTRVSVICSTHARAYAPYHLCLRACACPRHVHVCMCVYPACMCVCASPSHTYLCILRRCITANFTHFQISTVSYLHVIGAKLPLNSSAFSGVTQTPPKSEGFQGPKSRVVNEFSYGSLHFHMLQSNYERHQLHTHIYTHTYGSKCAGTQPRPNMKRTICRVLWLWPRISR